MEGEALHFDMVLCSHAQTHTTDLTSWSCQPVFHMADLYFLKKSTILFAIFKCFMWHIIHPFLPNKLEDRGSYNKFNFLLENTIKLSTLLIGASFVFAMPFCCLVKCVESTSLLRIYVASTIRKSFIHEFQNSHKRKFPINNGLWWGCWNLSVEL